MKSPKFDRLRVIDELLRKNDRIHKMVIRERMDRKGLKVSERTVFEDLSDLKDYGAPVRSDKMGITGIARILSWSVVCSTAKIWRR